MPPSDPVPPRAAAGTEASALTERLRIEPLRTEHLAALSRVLLHPAVYEHIGGAVPSQAEFTLGLQRALAGPPASAPGQTWLQFLVREAATGAMLGRLEATVHGGRAEVAFLFGPAHWGRGYAAEGLGWLHGEVARRCGVADFWATTVPANTRCQALLLRSGYVRVPGDAGPGLLSWDPGDWVYRRQHHGAGLPPQGGLWAARPPEPG